jgi:hypothetical protein
MMLDLLLLILAVALGLLLVLEVSLRLLFGFGSPPLYIADEKIGYLLAPNQCLRRFGNRFAINQYSMRSPQIAVKRPSSTFRVLLLGDSIANGASWTDQKQTISALIANQLEETKSFECVEVLNASANSWGPRNQLAYLQRFGTFEAQVLLLLLNIDDLFATSPTSVQVGRDRRYPNRNPPSAIVEVFQRYLLKAPPIPEMELVKAEGRDIRLASNLEAIKAIQAIALANNAKFLLAMTPRLWEIGESGSRDYEIEGRARLNEFIQTYKITYLDFLPVFKSLEKPDSLYRDQIHLCFPGNQKVSEALAQACLSLI